MIEQIFSILNKHRFSLEDEKETQRQIASVLTEAGIAYDREYMLDKNNIPDFFVIQESSSGDGTKGIAIEVKIKGGKKAIYKQCERYCQFDEVSSLILVTGRSMGMFKEINNKPVYLLNISRAWL